MFTLSRINIFVLSYEIEDPDQSFVERPFKMDSDEKHFIEINENICPKYTKKKRTKRSKKSVEMLMLMAFSVKFNCPNNKDITEKDYDPFFTNLYARVECVEFYCGEIGKNKILHFHGLITIKRSMFRKKLFMKGYHLQLREVYNLTGWRNYCYKNDILHSFEHLNNHTIKK